MRKKHFLAVALGTGAIIGTTISTGVRAAAFGLAEQSASGLGNALAGAAAVGEDASTIYFNPAGMSRLQGNQFVGGLHVIRPSIKFSDGGSSSAGVFQTHGGNGGQAGEIAVLPNLYGVYQLNSTVRLGLGINAPFGLVTDYDADWVGRFQATRSEVKSLNINPSVAWQVMPALSLGGGINYQQFEAELSNQVNYSGAIAGATVPGVSQASLLAAAAANPNREGTARVSGRGDGWGWNVGALYQVTPSVRAGFAYRSPIKQELRGDVNITAPSVTGALANAVVAAATAPGGQLASGNIRATITTPETYSLSAAWEAAPRWTVLGDITRTGWSRIQDLTFYRESGTILQSIPERWKDTWRYSVGAIWRTSDALRLRFGVAYDETPVSTEYRTARLPDNNRWWLSFGVGWQFTRALGVDVAYTHIFVDKGRIDNNQSNANAYGRIEGSYRNYIDILSAQMVYRF